MKKRAFFTIILAISFVCNLSYADKIAIIGGGASGLVTTWLLEQKHEVTLYEAGSKLGGHADSIELQIDGSPIIIEAGAEFFNEEYYPNFLKLLRFFNLPLNSFTLVTSFYKTDGSDQIILPPYHDGTVEWKSLTPTNLARSVQIKRVIDKGRDLLKKDNRTLVLDEFLKNILLQKSFKTQFFYPLIAAGWGIATNDAKDMSAFNAVKYLIEGYDAKKYQWYEIKTGMKSYVEALQHSFNKATIKLDTSVTAIGINNGHYLVMAADGSSEEFDQLIFATDASVASKILKTLPETAAIASLLQQIRYYETKIAIHSDPRFMPPNKEDWRVVNVRYDGTNSATTMYKHWKSKTPIFKTWITQDVRSPSDQGNAIPSNLHALITYQHPFMDSTFFKVQEKVQTIQGKNKIWFAGMWTWDNDSHESAIKAAINIARRLDPFSKRLSIFND